ncbi:MAG: J domain-containing protein [Desulfobacterium sp.]|nr:J domain-containing protein [Desulfobacterium sp.]
MEEGIMDEKRAMEILGLEKGFSLGEVKSAYRTLAKAFHPDRFGCDDGLRRAAEARMIDINLAVSVLIATAPKESEPGESEPGEKTADKGIRPTAGWWSRFFRGVAGRRPRPVAQAARPQPAPQPSPGRTGRRAGSGFAEVFETCMGKETVSRGRKSVKRRKGRTPVDYGTYLVMKQRMKLRVRPMDSGGIQPVSPVSPVTKIKN